MSEQTLKNHTRFVPSYHFFTFPVFGINFVWSLYRLRYLWLSFAGIFGALLGAALLVLALRARLFALCVQDRVLRLGERLRYERVLPEELGWRADELTVEQFIALRFASDDELPALMKKVLDEKITARKTIKQLIKNWRADYLRA